MLDTLLEVPFALNRHRDAPLLEERLAFLKYLQERGTSRAALRNVSGQMLHVIHLLKLETLRDVSVDEVKEAARRWGEQQRYPLQHEVGEAILDYITEARPRTDCRHLFVTLHMPHRRVETSSLWGLTSRRLKAAGILCRRSGPHSLRHACATHLLQEGLSLKEIGDLLGHRSAMSTGIYAKVDITMLRRVADFDLGGLL